MPEPNITINNRSNIAWVLLILAALWIIFSQWKSCGSQQQLAKQQQAYNDTLQSREQTITKLKNDSLIAAKHFQDSLDKLHKSDSIEVRTGLASANYWKMQNKKLADYIENNRPQPSDTMGYVLAPQGYVDSCEQCAAQLKRAFHAVDSANKLVDKTYDNMTTELLNRERESVILSRYADSIQSLFNASTRLTNQVLKDNRLHWSLWAGFEGETNPYYQSGGVIVTYQPKKGDQQYSLSGGKLTIKGTYLSAKAQFKIKLHK